MGKACNTHDREEDLLENLDDLDVDWQTILKKNLDK
jgi:hypothetical protein